MRYCSTAICLVHVHIILLEPVQFLCDTDELSVAIIVFVAFLESGASILSQMPSILLLKSWRKVKKVRKQHLCSNRPLHISGHDFTDFKNMTEPHIFYFI